MRKARKISGDGKDADVPPQTAAIARRPSLRSSPARLALYHALLLGGLFLFWYLMTEPGLIPPFYFDEPTRAKFFFGQPQEVFKRIWNWFAGGSIYLHLGVTLFETLLAFVIGTLLGLVMGLWLALAPTASTPEPANDVAKEMANHPPGCTCAVHLAYRKKAARAG